MKNPKSPLNQRNLRRLHGEGLLPECVFRTFLVESEPSEWPLSQEGEGTTDRAEAVSRQVDILRSTGELSPSELESVAIRLQEYAEESARPVLLRVLPGIGGWVAAASLALTIELVLHRRGLLPSGLALLVLAAVLSGKARSTFSSQLALALAFVGDVAILTAFSPNGWEHVPAAMPFLQLFLCLVLYPLLPNAVFRFAAPVSVGVLALFRVAEGDWAFWQFDLLVGAELILYLVLTLRERRMPAFFPLERAAAFLLPATLLAAEFVRIFSRPPIPVSMLWPSGLLLCGGLSVLLIHPAVELPSLSRPWRPVLGSVLLLGLFCSPGILAVLLLVFLGRARNDRYPTILGGLFLPVFLGLGFHAIHIHISLEAWVIAGCGLLLLWMRRLASRRPPEET